MKRIPIARSTRVEGAAVLAVSLATWWALEGSWSLFVLLLLVPDVCFVAYAAGKRVGAIGYNLTHTLVGPLLLAGVAVLGGQRALALAALIWLAHIGLDRALGFGLKPVR